MRYLTASVWALSAAMGGWLAYDYHADVVDVMTLSNAKNHKAAKYFEGERDFWMDRALSRIEDIKKLEAENLSLSNLVEELTPKPIVNPDPMDATMKLYIEGGGHGSGTHIGNGYVITAGHVAENEGDKLTAKFSDGAQRDAVTLWSSATYDVALLKIDGWGGPASNLECRAPDRRESIWLYGNPQSSEFIVTEGTVAGKPREMKPNWAEVVPVDAAMGPGMSGGGAFDADGDLVGINVGTQFSSRGGPLGPDVYTIGINMIVPSNVICNLMGRTE